MKIFWLLSMLSIAYCGDEEDRQEVVNKLRAVGVSAEPGIISYSLDKISSETIDLKAFFLLPKEKSLSSFTDFVDTNSKFSLPSSTKIVDQEIYCNEKIEEKYKDLGPLKLCYIKALSTVPKSLNFSILKKFNGVVKMRYGFDIKENTEQEIIVGDYIVVTADSKANSWKNHNVKISLDTDTIVLDPNKKTNEIKIKAIITKSFDEEVKVGWFISSGKIDNFRAADTKWLLESSDKGEQTIVLGLYGTKSNYFTLDARKVVIN